MCYNLKTEMFKGFVETHSPILKADELIIIKYYVYKKVNFWMISSKTRFRIKRLCTYYQAFNYSNLWQMTTENFENYSLRRRIHGKIYLFYAEFEYQLSSRSRLLLLVLLLIASRPFLSLKPRLVVVRINGNL